MVDRKKRERMKQVANRKQDSGDPGRTPLAADSDKEEWIGQQLRAVYDKTLNEPIPERFLELLKKIDEKDPESK
jgi:chorismate mutase